LCPKMVASNHLIIFSRLCLHHYFASPAISFTAMLDKIHHRDTEGTELNILCLSGDADKQKPSAISWHGFSLRNQIVNFIPNFQQLTCNGSNIYSRYSRRDSDFIQSTLAPWNAKPIPLGSPD